MEPSKRIPIASLLPSEPASPHPPRMKRADWRWFWAIAGLAIILRLAYFTGHVKTVYFSQPVLEARLNYETAQRSAARVEGIEVSTFEPMLYTWMMGVAYRLINPPVRLAFTYLLQHALGVLTVVLVFFTAFRVAGRRPAIVAALLTAVYAPLAALSNEALPTALIALEIIALLYFLICAATSRTLEYLFLAGGAFAACALTWPAIYLFLPVALARLCTMPPPVRAKGPHLLIQDEAMLRGARRWAVPAVFLIIPALAILFHGVATSALVGRFDPFPWRGGPLFYLSNGPMADGVFLNLPAMAHQWDNEFIRPAEAFAREGAPQSDEPLSPLRLGLFWYGKALSQIAANPGRWLSLMAKKALLLISQTEGYNQVSYSFLREINPFARIWPSIYGLIALFALLGFQATRNVPWFWPRHWVWLLVACLGASVALFNVDAQQRALLVPVLSIMAALGAQRAWRHLWRSSRRRALVRFGLPLIAVLVLIIFVDWFGIGRRRQGRDWWNYAWAAYQANEWSAAAQACDRSLELGERNAQVYVYRGDLYMHDNKTSEAIRCYRRAIAADHSYPQSYYALAMLNLNREDYAQAASFLKAALERAPKSPEYLAEFGLIALRAGDLDLAFHHLNQAYAWAPDNIAALAGLAEVYRRQNDLARYESLYRRAMTKDVAQTTLQLNRIRKPISPQALEAPAFQIPRSLVEEGAREVFNQ
ncbi:MAG: tetratricopeptide repeat protein [Candidatus Sumerlaeota bacterium]|nr:tetratricopeptide repeat protein [Candidatus Sumerlaeota bacterium]